MTLYFVILILLFLMEIAYFRIADRFNIIDKPNERSSHSKVVLRGGGVIFVLGLWIWSFFYGFHYPWLLAAVTMAAGVSFVDDVRSLPDSVRLVVQFAAMGMMLFQLVESADLQMINGRFYWILFVVAALIVCVGATNIYNFMDGINGITGAYSLAVFIPLYIVNRSAVGEGHDFVEESLLVVTCLSLVVFCFFNFRTRAKCFAGDVGSVGIAFILLFCIGRLIVSTSDVTWLVFLIVYGVDGCLTIIHRILLHENLGQAHRKHAYQLMSNELKMPHVLVSAIYAVLQLSISLIMIYVIPDDNLAHWIYLIAVFGLLAVVYISFMKKYYYLHEVYLNSLGSR